ATTSAPSSSNARGAIPEYAPLAQSTPMRSPARSAPNRRRTRSRYVSTATSRLSTWPASGSLGGDSSRASISSSSASASLLPSLRNSLTPLYSGGLCDAEITAPRSSASSATAGVGSTPASTACPPAEATPLANARSSSGPEPRVSRPIRTPPPPAHTVAARPSRSTSWGVRSSPTIPLTPSVPKYRRATARWLALAELRRFAGLVQAGLLALDDPRVAGEEALALQHGAQLRVG